MTGVHRLPAPNPGPMTGPGTNTYLVVSGRDCVIVDPDPLEESHLRHLAGQGTISLECDDEPGEAVAVRDTGGA